MFERAPKEFWTNRRNCRKYLHWLGKQLGYKHRDDWYRLKGADFNNNHGRMLLRRYRSSVAEVVMDLLPRRKWCEWKFTRVPLGFWDCIENRRRYVLWLGKRLGFRRAEDWRRVRKTHFCENYGGSLIVMYRSYWNMLQECIPEWDWTPLRKQRLSIAQILAWVDAHFAAHGKWPNRESGEIAGINETWMGVHAALYHGSRGLGGGITLTQLLNQHRDVRSNRKRASSLSAGGQKRPGGRNGRQPS